MAKDGPDLFGPASDCAPRVSAAEAADALSKAEFEAFYARYPRKKSKGFALRAWNKARKKAAFNEIMTGLEQYKFSADPHFQPFPGTWLNGERWRDVEIDLSTDPWGLGAWLPTAGELGWTKEAIEEIMTGANLDRTWRGDLETVAKWLQDGYRPDSIATVLAEETAKQGISPRFLAWLDRTVRARAFRWDENRLEWIRQKR